MAGHSTGSGAIGGNTANAGGVAGSGGSAGNESSEGGASAAPTRVSFGDFDDMSGDFPGVPPGSSSFFWGLPGKEVHLGNWFVDSVAGSPGDARIGTIEPPRGDSTKACHARGAEFAEAVDLYAQLNHPQNTPVDLSRYAGLTFWARLTAANPTLTVVLNDGNGSVRREGSFSGLFAGSFAASEQWQQFELPFSEPDRVSAVVSIDFIVIGGGDALDLWIDEVSLVCRGACR